MRPFETSKTNSKSNIFFLSSFRQRNILYWNIFSYNANCNEMKFLVVIINRFSTKISPTLRLRRLTLIGSGPWLEVHKIMKNSQTAQNISSKFYMGIDQHCRKTHVKFLNNSFLSSGDIVVF